MSWLEREQQGVQAVNIFLSQSCVFLVPGAGPPPAAEVASGTLVATPSGHIVVLTAKHVARHAISTEYRLGYHHCSDVVPDVVAGVVLHPGDVDVGLLLLKESVIPLVSELASLSDSVPEFAFEILPGDSLVINGFPAAASYYTREQAEQGFKLFTCWWQGREVAGDAHSRYRVPWRDVPGRESDINFQAVPPGGMSGGPLWRFRKAPVGSVWSPANIGRILGVQSAWDGKQTLFVEPVDKWSTWFHETTKHVESYFAR